MNYIVFIIGIAISAFGLLSIDLLIVGIGIVIISLFLAKPKPKEKTEKKKTSIVEKLEKVKFEPMHENALSNAISDTVAVTAKIANGKQPEVNAKTLVKGTLGVAEGIEKVMK
jgi:hypothetical protein